MVAMKWVEKTRELRGEGEGRVGKHSFRRRKPVRRRTDKKDYDRIWIIETRNGVVSQLTRSRAPET